MRVLVAALPAFGHLYPLMPLAAALRDAGDDVVLATGDPLAPAVRDAGWQVEDVPCDVAGARAELLRTRPRLATLPPAQRWQLGAALFAEVVPAVTAPRLLDVLARVRPDLVVYDDAHLGAAAAGAAAGIPVVRHGLGPLPRAVQERLAGTLSGHWPVPGTRPPGGSSRAGRPLPRRLPPPACTAAPGRRPSPPSRCGRCPGATPAPRSRPG
ncbi:hypothetical protein SAMN06893096_102401 [Geodermatophilus pulveris]|uniref:Erythromycin biosynthesis protein CIII-like N-terminal domain-containing protein n=1 Tax=Geodermatophilus pulveris TaxID=1564159 RepID=A0A239CEB6_9ACTN|nr:hypothetical protein [Geodermatophilus pulveris]SNS18537.1 hypothetical protein SAMN06893096_102401 [Geodermatophilus pulveris]